MLRIVCGALLTVLFIVLGTNGVSVASAYCRKTTCDPEISECSLDKHGCPRKGVILRWTNGPIVYGFHAAGTDRLERDDEARKAIRSAFARWTDVSCDGRRTSLRFEEQEDAVGGANSPVMEPNTIYFRDEPRSKAGAALGGDTLALTSLDHGAETGVIARANIEVNTEAVRFATRDDIPLTVDGSETVDLEAVVTHEVGHYIGLAHSDDPDSIMVPRYCASSTSNRCSKGVVEARRLSEDDARAVCVLFPPSPTAAFGYPDAPSCSLSSARTKTTARASSIIAAMLALCVAVCRRRRPRRPSLQVSRSLARSLVDDSSKELLRSKERWKRHTPRRSRWELRRCEAH